MKTAEMVSVITESESQKFSVSTTFFLDIIRTSEISVSVCNYGGNGKNLWPNISNININLEFNNFRNFYQKIKLAENL